MSAVACPRCQTATGASDLRCARCGILTRPRGMVIRLASHWATPPMGGLLLAMGSLAVSQLPGHLALGLGDSAFRDSSSGFAASAGCDPDGDGDLVESEMVRCCDEDANGSVDEMERIDCDLLYTHADTGSDEEEADLLEHPLDDLGNPCDSCDADCNGTIDRRERAACGGSSESAGPAQPTQLSPTSVTASRHLTGSQGDAYPPSFAFDGTNDTAWAVRDFVSGSDWIEARFARPVQLSSVRIATGYLKFHRRSGDLFVLNDHVRRARIETDQGSVVVTARESQRWIELPIAHETSRVRIVILDVWRGTRWADLSVSEIEMRGVESGGARPSTDWHCLCAAEEIRGFQTTTTACRPSSADCRSLADAARQNHGALRGLGRSCMALGSAEHPGDLVAGRAAWSPSPRAGSWQVVGRCVLPGER